DQAKNASKLAYACWISAATALAALRITPRAQLPIVERDCDAALASFSASRFRIASRMPPLMAVVPSGKRVVPERVWLNVYCIELCMWIWREPNAPVTPSAMWMMAAVPSVSSLCSHPIDSLTMSGMYEWPTTLSYRSRNHPVAPFQNPWMAATPRSLRDVSHDTTPSAICRTVWITAVFRFSTVCRMVVAPAATRPEAARNLSLMTKRTLPHAAAHAVG